MSDVHAADVISADLIGLYQRGAQRIAGIVQAGLQRGLDPSRAGGPSAIRGDASLQYRARQLEQVNAVLRELHAAAGSLGPQTIARTYTAGLVATDRSLARTGHAGTASVSPAFGTVHQRAVATAAGNLTDSLRAAVEHAGQNVAAVFERANRLEAGLPVDALPGDFVGRRVNDPFRGATIEQVGQGLVAGDARRDVSRALAERLVREGTTDALTGFVDRAGRRWDIGNYARMATRTTTREVMSRAVTNRLQENGQDLVTISSHPHTLDECTPYDGNTFSLSGDTPGYDVLDDLPPYHPNCEHVVTPAADTLDRFEAELNGAAREQAAGRGDPTERPPAPPTVKPPAPASAQAAQAAGRAVRERAEHLEAPALERIARNREQLTAEHQRLDALVQSLSRQAIEHPADADRFLEQLHPAFTAREQAKARLDALDAQVAAARQAAVVAALKEVRPGFGDGIISNATGRGAGAVRGRELLQGAARLIPREWVEASNAEGAIEVRLEGGRGYHQGRGINSTISIRDDPWNALHEFAHRLQGRVTNMAQLEREFSNARITLSNGAIARKERLSDVTGSLGYGASEVTRGAWTEAYAGRDYGIAMGGQDFPDLREILTIGLEGLFSGKFGLRRIPGDTSDPVPAHMLRRRENLANQIATRARRSRVQEEQLATLDQSIALIRSGDHDYVDFILGLLATL